MLTMKVFEMTPNQSPYRFVDRPRVAAINVGPCHRRQALQEEAAVNQDGSLHRDRLESKSPKGSAIPMIARGMTYCRGADKRNIAILRANRNSL